MAKLKMLGGHSRDSVKSGGTLESFLVGVLSGFRSPEVWDLNGGEVSQAVGSYSKKLEVFLCKPEDGWLGPSCWQEKEAS